MTGNDKTPGETGACQCDGMCAICHCQNSPNPPKNQAADDYKARIGDAIERFYRRQEEGQQ